MFPIDIIIFGWLSVFNNCKVNGIPNFDNGLTIQFGKSFGTGDTSSNTYQTIIFPISFTTTNYCINGADLIGTINYNYFNLLTESTSLGQQRLTTQATFIGSVSRHWIAIGY